MSTRGTQGNAPSIDMPPVPRTVVFVHVSARVCGLPEFRDAHGPDAVKAFAAVTPGSGNKSSIRVHPGVASSALLASVSSGPSGSVAAETVLADVMDALLADLVRDGDVDDTFDGLTQPKIPLFSTLTGGPSAATLTSSGDAEQRNSVLADTDGQELLAKLLENTVLNLVREAVHGEFDPTALPVTIVRRK
jgi:Fe-S-cluster formation regulator IscX/YfhJ